MITRALNDQSLPVYGKGENIRDWIYVEDHCNAIDIVMRKGRIGEVYNVGGNNEKSNLDVVRSILNALNKPETLISFVKDRPGHDMRYAIDAAKIHNEFGWIPKIKFEDGILLTIKWYVENKEWWESILCGEYQNYYEEMYNNRK
jgi:dTDP-glucose 4,6-dehydratase